MDSMGADGADGADDAEQDAALEQEVAATLLSATVLGARDLLKSSCGPSPSSITLTPPVSNTRFWGAIGGSLSSVSAIERRHSIASAYRACDPLILSFVVYKNGFLSFSLSRSKTSEGDPVIG